MAKFMDVDLRKYGEIIFSGLFRSIMFQARRVRVPESAHNILTMGCLPTPVENPSYKAERAMQRG